MSQSWPWLENPPMGTVITPLTQWVSLRVDLLQGSSWLPLALGLSETLSPGAKHRVCTSLDPSMPPPAKAETASNSSLWKPPSGSFISFLLMHYNHHQLSNTKPPPCISPQTCGSEVWHNYWVLCSGSHEAECRWVEAFRPNTDHYSIKHTP